MKLNEGASEQFKAVDASISIFPREKKQGI
jgi:hypothetical protein